MSGQMKGFGGTPLSEKDIAENRVLITEWHAQMIWAWDSGRGYGRYFAELKQGKIIGTKCKKCQRVLLPARAFCEWCFRSVDEWVYLQDTGTVNTYSIAYTDWVARRVTEPQMPALIEVDGSGGVGIMHLLGEVDPKDVKVGLRVKAVWKPEDQREGSVTDILYWKPI